MPRPNYSRNVRDNARNFLRVLVEFARGELDGDDLPVATLRERTLERLNKEIKVYFADDRRFIVRAKIRFLVNLAELTGLDLNAEKIKETIARWEDFLGILEDCRPSRQGSEVWHFAIDLWYPYFDMSANLAEFDKQWESRKGSQGTIVQRQIVSREKIASAATPAISVWREWLAAYLASRQCWRLTTNSLMGNAGMAFDLDRMFVPLDLERRRGSGDAGEGEEMEGVTISLEDFCADLLASSENSARQRIAIVGDPGAGKTTLLQWLAGWLLKRDCLPIWVSLVDLSSEYTSGVNSSFLGSYLLDEWLLEVMRQPRVKESQAEEFVGLFSSGKVWLLLDAVDEMALEPSVALRALARQFSGWVGDANVIMTSRSNVWDNGQNSLSDFTVYNNRSFSGRGSNSLAMFIDAWFASRRDLGDDLQLQLRQPQFRSIRNAVKNPLRLALLCRCWQSLQGKLPATRTDLYQQFKQAIYAWKQDIFPLSLSQRYELDCWLANLAFAALQNPAIKFRIPHQFAIDIDRRSIHLLETALQLGWLHRVGDIFPNGEPTYAFDRASFQEFFAALAIEDGNIFLDETENSQFLALDPDWQETAIFWLGRTDIKEDDRLALLTRLVEFDDRCGGFYSARATCLAAVGLTAYPAKNLTPTIFDRLLNWRFGKPDTITDRWFFYPHPLQDAAKQALRQTDFKQAITTLENYIQTSSNLFTTWQAAYSLGVVFDPGNQIALTRLISLTEEVWGEQLLLKICETIGKIDPQPNQFAIQKVTRLLDSATTETQERKIAYILAKIAPQNPRSRAVLERIATSSKDPKSQKIARENLSFLYPPHPELLNPSRRSFPKNRSSRQQYPSKQGDIRQEIASLTEKIQRSENPQTIRQAAYQLGCLDRGNRVAISTLIELFDRELPASSYKLIGNNIQEIAIDTHLPEIVAKMSRYTANLEVRSNDGRRTEAYKILWMCTQRLNYIEFRKNWPI
jgi:energy-coupling factor transporter ATP-binding protein EcfA2